MTKRVSFNGIEISAEAYNASAAGIFDYLETLAEQLENRLPTTDDNCNLAINLEFSPGKAPASGIKPNTFTNKKTVTHVKRALKSIRKSGNNHLSGNVKVNLEVRDH